MNFVMCECGKGHIVVDSSGAEHCSDTMTQYVMRYGAYSKPYTPKIVDSDSES